MTRTYFHDMLTTIERGNLYKKIEDLGPTPAPFGRNPDLEIRRASRVMFDDTYMARMLEMRLRPKLPMLTRINERFRGYRYGPGDYFKQHRDGCVWLNNERTTHTVLLYLNDGFAGGETVLHNPPAIYTPTSGACLIFRHEEIHESWPIAAGTKYVIRTDAFMSDS